MPLGQASGGRLLCATCAQTEELAFLPSGDPALTRRASRLSGRAIVVVAWNRRGKRWERRGTMVEEDALAEAEAQCLLDEDRRAKARVKQRAREELRELDYVERFALAIREEFPGLDVQTASTIAGHACEKHSGRVGRSAAAKQLERDLVIRAVIAHARHLHTGYDALRDAGMNKRDSRGLIREDIRRILAEWRKKPCESDPATES
jgi:hypothetical protein